MWAKGHRYMPSDLGPGQKIRLGGHRYVSDEGFLIVQDKITEFIFNNIKLGFSEILAIFNLFPGVLKFYVISGSQ